MNNLRTGWRAINQYVLTDGQFNNGETWILKDDSDVGFTDCDNDTLFGLSVLASMAIYGNGFKSLHQGNPPLIAVFYTATDTCTDEIIINRLYSELSSYYNAYTESDEPITGTDERLEFISEVFAMSGFKLELTEFSGLYEGDDDILTIDSYRDIVDAHRIGDSNILVVATYIINMDFIDDVVSKIEAISAASPSIVQLVSIGRTPLPDDYNRAGVVSIDTHTGYGLNLSVSGIGATPKLFYIPFSDALSLGWTEES